MSWRSLIAVLGALFPLVSFAGEPKDHGVAYVYSMEDAMQLSKDEDRLVYVVFKGRSCPWCDRQSEEMSKPEVVKSMRGLVVFLADVSENRELARKYGVSSVPAHRLIDSDGKVIKSSFGYMDASEMEDFLAR